MTVLALWLATVVYAGFLLKILLWNFRFSWTTVLAYLKLAIYFLCSHILVQTRYNLLNMMKFISIWSSYVHCHRMSRYLAILRRYVSMSATKLVTTHCTKPLTVFKVDVSSLFFSRCCSCRSFEAQQRIVSVHYTLALSLHYVLL